MSLNIEDFQLDIHEAIDGVYRTFAQYKVTFPLESCPCCFEQHIHDKLASKPLRELSVDDMSAYMGSAVLTVGTVEDFKHFLPRIFELYACNRNFPVNPEIIFSRLPYISWRTEWLKNEQCAIERYLMSLWGHMLKSSKPTPFIGECLCSIAQVVDDIHCFLDYWLLVMSRSYLARKRMAEFVCDEFYISQIYPLSTFWHDVTHHGNVVIAWMRETETAKQVERALTEWSDTDEGREYIYLLGEYHSWRKNDLLHR